LSRASIIAEIRQDIAACQKVIELLGGGKTVSIDEVVGKPRRKMSALLGRRLLLLSGHVAKVRAAAKKGWEEKSHQHHGSKPVIQGFRLGLGDSSHW